jgi:hypothetical protein
MRNEFTQETRNLFYYNYHCFYCGFNQWNALHHILGRVSASPLNACPIHNIECHIGNAKLTSFEMISILLKKTLVYLLEEGYILTEEDRKFKERYKQYYELS